MSHPSHPSVEVLIIGGGQAGLSASYHLSRQGIHDQVILEKNRTFHSWREERWDSFCLVTPNFQCRLPGHPYDGEDPEGFMTREEIVAYLERFATLVEAPVHEGVAVEEVLPQEEGFLVRTSAGSWWAHSVICAIGAHHTPILPPGTDRIPGSIRPFFATEYRNPDQMPPHGAIAVVGSGQSGCQIAEDLHRAGREVHLFLGNAPRSPRRYRGKDAVTWLEEMGYYETTFAELDDPEKALHGTNHYLSGRDGGKEIDLRAFAREGLRLHGYLEEITATGFRNRPDAAAKLDTADRSYLGIRQRIDDYIARAGIDAPVEPPYEPCWHPPADEPTFLPFAESGLSAVIWCIGFRPSFPFLPPGATDARGHPRQQRGISPLPGLYFLGLPWQHTWGSARFSGVSADAAFLAEAITRKRQTTPRRESASSLCYF